MARINTGLYRFCLESAPILRRRHFIFFLKDFIKISFVVISDGLRYLFNIFLGAVQKPFSVFKPVFLDIGGVSKAGLIFNQPVKVVFLEMKDFHKILIVIWAWFWRMYSEISSKIIQFIVFFCSLEGENSYSELISRKMRSKRPLQIWRRPIRSRYSSCKREKRHSSISADALPPGLKCRYCCTSFCFNSAGCRKEMILCVVTVSSMISSNIPLAIPKNKTTAGCSCR